MSIQKFITEFIHKHRKLTKVLEWLLSLSVLAGVVYFAYNSAMALPGKDWADTKTFYDFISLALLLIIGLEFSRLIISHSFSRVLELIILIIARKIISPELHANEVLLAVIALAIIVGLAYLYDAKPLHSLEDLSD